MIGRRGSAAGRDVEVELKYRLAAVAAGERYLTADELDGFRPVSRVRTTQLEDRYLDTADGALARAGFAARLRVSTAGTVVSVKSIARQPARSALHRREELEGPADRTSSPRDWPGSPARSLMLELCGEAPLIEVVTIRQLRRQRELREGATVVELSLDEVDVVARSRLVDRFAELEIELVRGDEQRLVTVAAVLDADPALDGSRGSKFEAALAAVRAHVRRHGPLPVIEVVTEPSLGETDAAETRSAAPVPRVAAASVRRGAARRIGAGRAARRVVAATTRGASSPDGATPLAEAAPREAALRERAPREPASRRGIDPGDTVADVRRALLRRQLKPLAAANDAVRARGNAADVAAMRSAVRQLLGVSALFGAGSADAEPYVARLRVLLDRLDAVRELDSMLGASATATAPPPLLEGWARDREDARRVLVRDLESSDHIAFTDDLAVLLRRHALADAADLDLLRVRDMAGSRLWAAYERVTATAPQGSRAGRNPLAALSEATDALDMALELLATALGPEARPVRGRVAELRDGASIPAIPSRTSAARSSADSSSH